MSEMSNATVKIFRDAATALESDANAIQKYEDGIIEMAEFENTTGENRADWELAYNTPIPPIPGMNPFEINCWKAATALHIVLCQSLNEYQDGSDVEGMARMGLVIADLLEEIEW